MYNIYTVRYNPISNQYDVILGDKLIESWRKSDDAHAHCYDLNHNEYDSECP